MSAPPPPPPPPAGGATKSYAQVKADEKAAQTAKQEAEFTVRADFAEQPGHALNAGGACPSCGGLVCTVDLRTLYQADDLWSQISVNHRACSRMP